MLKNISLPPESNRRACRSVLSFIRLAAKFVLQGGSYHSQCWRNSNFHFNITPLPSIYFNLEVNSWYTVEGSSVWQYKEGKGWISVSFRKSDFALQAKSVRDAPTKLCARGWFVGLRKAANEDFWSPLTSRLQMLKRHFIINPFCSPVDLSLFL